MVIITSDNVIVRLQKEIDYALNKYFIKDFTKRKGVFTKQRKLIKPLQERIIPQDDYCNKLTNWIKKYNRIVFYGWDDILFSNPNNLKNLKEALSNAYVSVIISEDKIPSALEEITKKKEIDILNLQGRKINKGYIIITQNGLDNPTHIAVWDSTIKVDEEGTLFRSVFPVELSPKTLEGVVCLAEYHKTLEYFSKKKT